MNDDKPIELLKSYKGKKIFCLNMYKIALPTLLAKISNGDLELPKNVAYASILDGIMQKSNGDKVKFILNRITQNGNFKMEYIPYQIPYKNNRFGSEVIMIYNIDGHAILISTDIMNIRRAFKKRLISIENELQKYEPLYGYKTIDILNSKLEIIKLKVASEIKEAFKLSQS